MYIALCDDDREWIDKEVEYIDDISDGTVKFDKVYSGEKLIAVYQNGTCTYDAILLDMDMEMEKLNGIETANLIRKYDEHVIIVFVTSYKKYMRESFKCVPFRFLIKPINYSELENVFYDMCKKISKQRKVFAFSENKTKVRLYCESQDHWVWIHTKDNKYKICKPLSELVEQLDQDLFCRIHRSFIINFLYIKYIRGNNVALYHCDKPIPKMLKA